MASALSNRLQPVEHAASVVSLDAEPVINAIRQAGEITLKVCYGFLTVLLQRILISLEYTAGSCGCRGAVFAADWRYTARPVSASDQ